MAGLDDTDGYEGTATVAVGESRFEVQVRLRGHFEPIDGRYHWYGRIAAHEGLDALLGSAKAGAVLSTPEGSAPCEVSEPDLSGRYRVAGISTPPFRAGEGDPGPGPAGAEAVSAGVEPGPAGVEPGPAGVEPGPAGVEPGP